MTSGPAAAASRPRLSLGLPVYNGERFLAACVDSLLGQTFGDFELICCDNASTDGTAAMLAAYAARDPRVRIHRAEVNRGAAPNFNWTFELAGGELFKWCAADDVLEPTFLERCVAALDAHPDAVMAWSGAVDIDDDGRVLREIYDNRDPQRFDDPDVGVRFQDLVCRDHSCIAVFGVIRSAALKRTSLIGPYVGSDRTLLAELGLQGRLLRVGDDLMRHREHAGRSVNAIKDLRRRTAWFDAKARGRAFPHWRLLREYLRAVRQSGLPLGQRARCAAGVARWVKWRAWRQLWDDVSANLGIQR